MAAKKDYEKDEVLNTLRVLLSIIGLVALVLACYWGFRLGEKVFSDEPMTVNKGTHITCTLTVEKGENVLRIGRELEKAGVIDSALAFWIQSRLYECRIDPGTYTVSSKNSSKEILKYFNQEYVNAHKDSQ